MRLAKVSTVVAVILFLGGATATLGSWAVSASCGLFVLSAVIGAVAMEDRELNVVEGLAPSDPMTPASR